MNTEGTKPWADFSKLNEKLHPVLNNPVVNDVFIDILERGYLAVDDLTHSTTDLINADLVNVYKLEYQTILVPRGQSLNYHQFGFARWSLRLGKDNRLLLEPISPDHIAADFVKNWDASIKPNICVDGVRIDHDEWIHLFIAVPHNKTLTVADVYYMFNHDASIGDLTKEDIVKDGVVDYVQEKEVVDEPSVEEASSLSFVDFDQANHVPVEIILNPDWGKKNKLSPAMYDMLCQIISNGVRTIDLFNFTLKALLKRKLVCLVAQGIQTEVMFARSDELDKALLNHDSFDYKVLSRDEPDADTRVLENQLSYVQAMGVDFIGLLYPKRITALLPCQREAE